MVRAGIAIGRLACLPACLISCLVVWFLIIPGFVAFVFLECYAVSKDHFFRCFDLTTASATTRNRWKCRVAIYSKVLVALIHAYVFRFCIRELAIKRENVSFVLFQGHD